MIHNLRFERHFRKLGNPMDELSLEFKILDVYKNGVQQIPWIINQTEMYARSLEELSRLLDKQDDHAD